MTVRMVGGPEARCVAAATATAWTPGLDGVGPGDVVVAFASFEGLLATLRRRPERVVWRPTGQPLPLPRSAPWALARVDAVVAPDPVVGGAIGLGAPVPTLVVPTAIGTTRSGPPPPTGAGAAGPFRLAVVLDTVDHGASAVLTTLAALDQGLLATCDRCGPAPLRFDPLTARMVEARADDDRTPAGCACGRPLRAVPPLDLRAELTVQDETLAPWAHDYLAQLRTWFGLDGRLDLDGDPGRARPVDDADLVARLSAADLHLSASGTPSLPRGTFLAAAAGVPSVVPGAGAAADLSWLRPCGHRTDLTGDDGVRIWLDPTSAAAEVLHLARAPDDRRALADAVRQAVAAHDAADLAPTWLALLDRVAAGRSPRPTRGLPGLPLLPRRRHPGAPDPATAR